MSLVNKMLRDLDARHVGAAERGALPAAVTPLARHQPSSRLMPTLLNAALLALALGGSFAWFQLQQGRTEPGMPDLGTSQTPGPPARAPAPVVAAETPATTPAEPAPVPAEAPTAAVQSLRLADGLTMLPTLESQRTKKAPPPAAKPPADTKREAPPPARPRVETPAAPALTPTVPAQQAASAVPPAQAVEARVDKTERRPAPAERAEAAYRRGLAAQRQGDGEGAMAGFRAALDDHPEHAGARQALVAQLIEQRRFDEAEDSLRKGIELAPTALSSTLALARLKVERGQAAAALDTLLRHSATGERSAEFQGFAGALLNRAGRSSEAAERYRAATRLAPAEARWWAGLGIALDAGGRAAEAREAFLKARSLPGLPADLAQYVEQRLR